MSPTPIDASSATRRSISSKRRISSRSSQGSPSAGMQYWQRKLQRSVTETRTSPMRPPVAVAEGLALGLAPTARVLAYSGRLTTTHVATAAKAMTPKVSAVPRLVAPSSSATSVTTTSVAEHERRSTLHRTPGLCLEGAEQRGDVGARVLRRQRAQGRAPPAERAQPALAVLGDEVGQRARAARRQAPGGEVEPRAVGVERGDELVDARRRWDRGDRDDRDVAPARASAARR